MANAKVVYSLALFCKRCRFLFCGIMMYLRLSEAAWQTNKVGHAHAYIAVQADMFATKQVFFESAPRARAHLHSEAPDPKLERPDF